MYAGMGCLESFGKFLMSGAIIFVDEFSHGKPA